MTRVQEHDACALIAFVDKHGRPSHANITKTVDALKNMAHRSGDIGNEGDGCGIQVDLPRAIWAEKLAAAGMSPHLAESPRFCVGHFFLRTHDPEGLWQHLAKTWQDGGVDLLLRTTDAMDTHGLGPLARHDPPLFWQVAGMVPDTDPAHAHNRLFRLALALESPQIHVCSLSTTTAVYKLRGTADLLPQVYQDVRDPRSKSAITLGHGRYSTNTLPTPERAQPFFFLAHNGEINTIDRLRRQAQEMGLPLAWQGSDSQDVDRILAGLVFGHSMDLVLAMELLFPPVPTLADQMPDPLPHIYRMLRWFFPSPAQGPAAIVARHDDLCLGSVDALGLRPLWFGETDYEYFLSSEKGVVDLLDTMQDPRPLAPGEKIAFQIRPGSHTQVLDVWAIQGRICQSFPKTPFAEHAHRLHVGVPPHLPQGDLGDFLPWVRPLAATPGLLAAFGWTAYDQRMRQYVAATGQGPIGSLGYQGPLAALDPHLPNIADYLKESVAVVTNPAIDREREAEHFSTHVIVGVSPAHTPRPGGVELSTPILLGGLPGSALPSQELEALCQTYGTASLEQVLSVLSDHGKDPRRVCVGDATFRPERGIVPCLERLWGEVAAGVAAGAHVIVLDDSRSFHEGRVFIDPALAVAWLTAQARIHNLALPSLVVRSGAIRNLHDIMVLLGLGACAVNPYLIWHEAEAQAAQPPDLARALANTLKALQAGIEKVLSTMGIHALTGYGRIFAAIGLKEELAHLLECPAFCTAPDVGLGFAECETMSQRRLELAQSATALPDHPKRNIKVSAIIRAVAQGETGFRQMEAQFAALDTSNPIALRHLMELVLPPDVEPVPLHEVDLEVDGYALPLVIAAMSFGSQGERSFRAYAEAAWRMGIVCMNGEGGEIADMLGRYGRHRGQQVASGRFGVSMAMLNSAAFIEIKIGQGAKPGEGGHLPGAKVTPQVAKARHCQPGIALISPSNHHDIYSIEDLCQIITELKTANPGARISVKIPVTPGIATIAVGIAKAGAHVIAISGYEGGTGAAREHAKKYVGLPVEIGVREAHAGLVEAGLRSQVEIWADGGLRSAADVVKLICLGANRVALGTAALMAVGCIACERCHEDRCPRGISTQIQDSSQAQARGIRAFRPLDTEKATEGLCRMIAVLGEAIRSHVAELGVRSIRDLVGDVRYLHQAAGRERISLASLLAPLPESFLPQSCPTPRLVRKPLNTLTKVIAETVRLGLDEDCRAVRYREEYVRSVDRAIGTALAGIMTRESLAFWRAEIELTASIPGNGLCAFAVPGMAVRVEGGGQDGIAKGASGGETVILKGRNILGKPVDGSVGKSLAYGATGGFIAIQNLADSRACVRLCGADVVLGARITAPVDDSQGHLAAAAHLKGFAFEYMTGGRVVSLGDPGPWICSGMTGGIIYQCLYPEWSFTQENIRRRLARGSHVILEPVGAGDVQTIQELLGRYIQHLRASFQEAEVQAVTQLAHEAEERFVKILPALSPAILPE
jgi:glutamate synthase (NADPH/NADH) large chain